MKKIVSCLIVVMSLLVFTLPLQAADEIRLYINSEKINTDAAPVLVNGRMLVALASLKKLNLDLQWNNETKQVTVASPNAGHTLVLTAGSKTAMLGDTKMTLDEPARVIKGRVYVPVRFVGEAFQADVKWLPDIRSVVIRSADKKEMYEALYHGDDLVEARKIAVFLPTEDENTLGSTGEMHSHTLIFPEGEALRYYHVWGNLYSYYEIKHDVKRLVWEGVLGAEEGSYDQERGTRPPEDKSRVYFNLDRFQSDMVHYWKDGEGEIHYGNSAQPGKYVDSYLSNAVIPIPDEVRIDQVK